jgi:Heparinase II/III-like protein/Heparinase II/III N-terminus
MRQMRSQLGRARDVFQTFGWPGLVRRGVYMAQVRSGRLERQFPVRTLEPLVGFRFPYRFDLERVRQLYAVLPGLEQVRETVLHDSERLLAGEYPMFSSRWQQLNWPPRWLENPDTGRSYDASQHWSRVPDLDPVQGDIKAVWEPSRFGFVYLLARAHALTNDARFGAAFWEALEGWVQANTLHGGPNWRCGQETSLRVMGVLFGLLCFADHPAASRSRLELAGAMLHASALRVQATLGYAMSQRNNHALSEVVGLWTLAVLFPQWPESAQLQAIAERGLAEVLEDQFYPDGAYVQQSFNYQRLAMHDLAWLEVVAGLVGRPVPTGVRETLGRSARFLHAIQDETSGWLPNYGANDGALILPLSSQDYRDYRPTLQAAHLLALGSRLYAPGPFDEEAIWLAPEVLAREAAGLNVARGSLAAETGGYYVLRGPQSFALTRASRFWHRPGQADMLHLDVWLNGLNVALDPGTYSYNKPAPWDNGLAATRVHNTGNADGLDQMVRAGRFLWLDWVQGQVVAYSSNDHAEVYVLETRLMPSEHGRSLHRRVILRYDDSYLIADSLEVNTSEHDEPKKLSVHWNLADLDWARQDTENLFGGEGWMGRSYTVSGVRVCVAGESNFKIDEVRAESDGVRGWQSKYYGVIEPCLGLDMTKFATKAQFLTAFVHEADPDPHPGLVRGILALVADKSETHKLNTAILAILGETK